MLKKVTPFHAVLGWSETVFSIEFPAARIGKKWFNELYFRVSPSPNDARLGMSTAFDCRQNSIEHARNFFLLSLILFFLDNPLPFFFLGILSWYSNLVVRR